MTLPSDLPHRASSGPEHLEAPTPELLGVTITDVVISDKDMHYI